MKKENILIVFDHIGGFKFMSPYLKQIESNKNLIFITYDYNLKYLKEFKKKKIITVNSKISITDALNQIKKYNIVKLFFSTSEGYKKKNQYIEPLYLKASIKANIKSICFLDYYKNLKERLNYSKFSKVFAKPTLIFMDSEFQTKCKNLIKQFDNMFFIKNLNNDYLSNFFYNKIRHGQKKNNKIKNIIFFSQPITERGFKKKYGYDELEVLNLIVDQLNVLNSKQYKYKLTIIIHPSENKSKFKLFKKKFINADTLENSKLNNNQIVLMIGMFSTILNPMHEIFNNVVSIQLVKNKKFFKTDVKCEIVAHDFKLKNYLNKKTILKKNFLNMKQKNLILNYFKKINEKI
jgi:hypothetical protein